MFKNIPDEIVVLIKGRKVVMAATMDADKGYCPGVYLLQGLTMADGNKQIFSTMKNVGMTFYFRYPEVGT